MSFCFSCLFISYVHDFGGKSVRVRWLMWIIEAEFMFLIRMSDGGVGLKHSLFRKLNCLYVQDCSGNR